MGIGMKYREEILPLEEYPKSEIMPAPVASHIHFRSCPYYGHNRSISIMTHLSFLCFGLALGFYLFWWLFFMYVAVMLGQEPIWPIYEVLACLL